MSNTYEICFTGQIYSISPEDVDFILQIEVTDVVDTKGTFSLNASDPSEFYGEKYLEWGIKSGEYYEGRPDPYDPDGGGIDLWMFLSEPELVEIDIKYFDKIEELLWEAIDAEREDSYDPPEPYDYPEESWK